MPKAINVSHITYRAWDMEKSLDFFVNSLGFYEQRRGSIVYVGIGDTLVELGSDQSVTQAEPVIQDPNHYAFGVAVDDLDAMVTELEKNGVEIVKPIWNTVSFWGRQAVVAPPGGQQVALREWREPDGPHFTDWKPE